MLGGNVQDCLIVYVLTTDTSFGEDMGRLNIWARTYQVEYDHFLKAKTFDRKVENIFLIAAWDCHLTLAD